MTMETKLKVKFSTRKMDELIPSEYNPRKISQEAKKRLSKSLHDFGYVDPIIININPERKNTIISGHQRYYILKEEGVEEVDVVEVNVDKDKEKLLNIAMNNRNLMGDWDEEKLTQVMGELFKNNADLSMAGFGELELDNILGLGIDEKEDEIPEIPKEPKSKLGELYLLEKHRVLCADSSKEDNIVKLMSHEKGKLVFTSPPYNMAGKMYENYKDNLESTEYIKFNLKVVNNLKKFLNGFLFWNISYNKNSRWEFIEIMYRLIKDTNLEFLEMIVWDKGHGIPITSNKLLTREYEDILVMADEDTINRELDLFYLGATERKVYFNKVKGKALTNYWRIGTNKTQIDSNLACFPVKLPQKAIILTTNKDDIVIDPFLGSGSTLIACEKTGRICFGMEIDPRYVDVIVKRWEDYTNKKAKLVKSDEKKDVEIVEKK